MNKKNIGKKQVALVLSIVAMAILISAAGLAVAESDSVFDLLGQRAADVAKEKLPFVYGNPNILAMSDAGHVIVGGKVGGKTTEECIDGVIAPSGCTIGKGNLLLIHRSKEKPLWFAFFNKSSGECVYLEVDSSVFDMTATEVKALSDDEVFTKIAKANVDADELFANPESWPKVFGGNEFSIITIANVWAKGAPYEFLKAAEFHNHICPGLTSGYLIIEYLDENLPLQSNQNYEIIGCPPWCKDDAFQVIFDKTVGKRFVAMHLTPEDSAQLPEYYAGPGKGGVAGIFIRWDKTTDTGHGLVLAYNRTKATEVSDIDPSLAPHKSVRKLKTLLALMDYFDQPELFVTTVQEFDLNSTAELMELKYAGNNPYVVLGLLPDPALANLVGPDNIAVDNLLGWRAAEIAKEKISFDKYDLEVLAMTDSGYAIVGGEAGGKTTEKCVDGVIASTGCTIGNGNLLLLHRSKEQPLWFAFFNNATGEFLYLEVDNSVFELSTGEFNALSDEEVFTTIVKEKISAEEIFNHQEEWNAKKNAKVFNGNEFSLITIANVWAAGAPYEFLKAVEFHNHVCPGLSSGYVIVRYLDENLPLQSSSDKYEIIGCPIWCKDDAIQVIFDKTVGKRYVATLLTDEDKAQLPRVAGIYIRWNGTTNTGDGLVLKSDSTPAKAKYGYNFTSDFSWIGKLSRALFYGAHFDEPELFVSTMHEFTVNSTEEIQKLKYAGVNPYVELGLLNQSTP
ncbi:putative formylmethanofuran dehydrogenase subunit E [Methanophagales archaeon]|nr:putative formylmethanofuran dehydrogenase subunit E [Methanophagales archaeon]